MHARTLADGRRVDALAFVMRCDATSYTRKLSDPIVRTVLGCASGRYGTTLDYVSRTVEALRESCMPDRTLETLLPRLPGGRSDGMTGRPLPEARPLVRPSRHAEHTSRIFVG